MKSSLSYQDKNIIAPFSGKLGTRGISSSILGTNSIILTLDDSKKDIM